MRSIALVMALTVLAGACADDESDTVTPPPVSDREANAVRVTGTMERVADTWALCPGAVTPCWRVVDDGGLELVAGPVIAVGDWDRNTIALRETEAAPAPWPNPAGYPNPCIEMSPQGAVFDQSDQGANGAVRELIADMGEDYAGSWIAQPGPILVIAVIDRAADHSTTVETMDLVGVCIAGGGAQGGFEHPYAELLDAQEDLADRLPQWADKGWVGLSVGINTIENRVDVYFDEIDSRLRREIESSWGQLVRIFAAVEVLDGTVASLERPLPANEIPIATQPRQAGGMLALGEFILEHDSDGDCLYLDAGDDRLKPIWPFGTRAARDPVRVIDGQGQVVGLGGEEIELGGGLGQLLPDSDDPTDCGAAAVWVVAGP